MINTEQEKCPPGCKTFTGGDRLHLKDCPFYMESLTKIYDDIVERLKKVTDFCESEGITVDELIVRYQRPRGVRVASKGINI